MIVYLLSLSSLQASDSISTLGKEKRMLQTEHESCLVFSTPPIYLTMKAFISFFKESAFVNPPYLHIQIYMRGLNGFSHFGLSLRKSFSFSSVRVQLVYRCHSVDICQALCDASCEKRAIEIK